MKTSLAPGSTVVTEYLEQAGLTEYLDKLGFNLVGYGCTTCIGNSGPLPPEISEAVNEHDLVVCSVLSGNRNFEGRINQDVRNNYLASPPLCVAYALTGRMDVDILNDPLGEGSDGEPVYLRDVWPSGEEMKETVASAVRSDMFTKSYDDVFTGDERWSALEIPEGDRYDVARLHLRPQPAVLRRHGARAGGSRADPRSASPRRARRQRHHRPHLTGRRDQEGQPGRALADGPRGRAARLQLLRLAARQPRGDDPRHVRQRPAAQPAGRARGRLHPPLPRRRGDDHLRGRDALRGGGVPLVVLAGKEYGSGSSRDWAAKGTALLGVRAVLAESFERIHRSNLIGMGVLPLQFQDGAERRVARADRGGDLRDRGSRGGGGARTSGRRAVGVTATRDGADPVEFEARSGWTRRTRSPTYRNGGILQRVLRDLR